MEDMLVKYADRAFCYAVCAFLLIKDYKTGSTVKDALTGVRDALTELKNAINVLVERKV